jgi:probable addiction module antidote protein
MGIVTLKKWDVIDHLDTDEDMAAYFDACLNEDPGDGSLIRAALGDIARAKGMTNLARDTGLTREGLYKALSSSGNPELSTIIKVIRALGIHIRAEVVHA